MKPTNANPSTGRIAAALVAVAWFISALGARAQTPANDLCAGAIALTNDVYYSETTTSATDDTVPCLGTISKGVWFKFAPSLSGVTVVDTLPQRL